MESNLFYVINGRSLSDNPANFTFFCGNGCSTIDWIWSNYWGLNIVKDMMRSDLVLSSDHLPIILETNVAVGGSVGNSLKQNGTQSRNKLRWKGEYELMYKNSLEGLSWQEDLEGLIITDIEEGYHKLIWSIRNGDISVGMGGNSFISDFQFKNKLWFDLECNVFRRDLRKKYRQAKNNNFHSDSLDIYLSFKKDYRNFLKQKSFILE